MAVEAERGSRAPIILRIHIGLWVDLTGGEAWRSRRRPPRRQVTAVAGPICLRFAASLSAGAARVACVPRRREVSCQGACRRADTRYSAAACWIMSVRNAHSHAAEAPRWFEVVPLGLAAGFILLVVGLIFTLALGLANLKKVSESTRHTAHTYAVKAQLQRVLTTAVDAETGERGFIITGTPGYLEPYESALAEMTQEMAQLRTLVADNPDQVADLNRLATATETKFAELAEAIRQRRDSGSAAAEAVVRTNVGKRTMDDMRVVVARMEAREDALLVCASSSRHKATTRPA